MAQKHTKSKLVIESRYSAKATHKKGTRNLSLRDNESFTKVVPL